MKKHKPKTKAQRSNNANTVLNEVGGAVKLKWKHSKKDKQWYINENPAWANNGMCITDIRHEGTDKNYRLHMDEILSAPSFRKLSSAKIVAKLIKHG